MIATLAVLTTIVGTAAAPASEPAPDAAADRDAELLAAHNRHREAHCAPPLVWSARLAEAAADWLASIADDCSSRPPHPWELGTNAAWHSSRADFAAVEIVDSWYAESERFDFTAPGYDSGAGHFTQLVWRATLELGCAVEACDDQVVWVCYYAPAGNELGEFEANVRPADCG